MTQRQCLQQACKQRYATHFPVKTSGCLKIRKQYIPSLSCFPNEAQQRSSKAAITELQKNSSWQWSSLRKALFTPRGLQEAVSVCTVSPELPAWQSSLLRCAALWTLSNCQVKHRKASCFPCLGTSCYCTPLASQVPHAVTAKRHNCVNAAGSPPVLQRFSIADFQSRAQAAESCSKLLRTVTSDNSPEREELQLRGRYVIRFCLFSTESDILKHKVNESHI